MKKHLVIEYFDTYPENKFYFDSKEDVDKFIEKKRITEMRPLMTYEYRGIVDVEMHNDLLTPQEDLRDWLVRNWDIAVKDSIGLSLQTMVVDAKKDMKDLSDRDDTIEFISERLKEGFLNVLDTYTGEL